MSSDVELPPKIPNELSLLTRALTLLVQRSRGVSLRRARDELISLIGVYPNPPLAALWIPPLKGLAKDMRKLGVEVADPDDQGDLAPQTAVSSIRRRIVTVADIRPPRP